MSPIRYGSKELSHKVDDGDEEAEDNEAKVDVETDAIVLGVGDGTRRSVGVIGEQEVGDSRSPAVVSITGNRGRS